MISSLVNKVSFFLFKNNIIDEEQIPAVNYGLQYLLMSLFMGITLIIIGIIFSQILQMLGLLLGFFLMRNTIGGYHTKKESTCFIMTVSMLTADLLLIKLISYFNPFLAPLIIIFSWILIILIKPVEHQNRKFSEAEFKMFRRKSIFNMAFITLLSIIAIVLFKDWGMLFATSLFVGVLTAQFAVIVVIKKNKRMCKNENKIN